jgi:hypothetical protein
MQPFELHGTTSWIQLQAGWLQTTQSLLLQYNHLKLK